jgi:methyl-accepting chemotaxis protein
MDERIAKRVDERIKSFKRYFLMVTTSMIGLTALGYLLFAIGRPEAPATVVFLVVGLALAATCFALAYRGRVEPAAKAFVWGNLPLIGLPMLITQSSPPASLYASIGLVVLAPFLLRPIYAVIFGGAFVATVLLANATTLSYRGLDAAADEPMIMGVILIASAAVALYLFTREAVANTEMLTQGARENEEVNREILLVASRLGAATGQIFAMTQEQTEAALHQSSAVEETRQVLRSVADASAEIVASAQQTLENAEVTLQNSQRVAENIRTLSNHTQDIFRILEGIREVADKSDLLALNAALEGTKAGEVGRGFSLVASQMQRLAENTARSVRDIQELTHDIRQATTETQLSMEEATKLASATTEAAHKINLITQQQRSGVEQVSTAMDDIVELTTRVATSTKQTIASTTDLQEMSGRLTGLVRSFGTGSAGAGGATA